VEPGYVRVADALRRRIEAGDLAPGDKLAARNALAAQYGVTPAVARGALRMLADEGLVELGKGRVPVVTAPSVRCVVVLDVHPAPESYEPVSGPIPAPSAVAARLGITAGDPVMRTLYRHRGEGGGTLWVTVSWEPLAVTGTHLESVPEVGEHRGVGVVARMARIGVTVERVEWRFLSRSASHEEARELGVAAGSGLTVVERTHVTVDGRRVETADLLAPAGRCVFVHSSRVAARWP
jgi:GntR family transcriptional regulator